MNTGYIEGSAGKKKIFYNYVPCRRVSNDYFIYFHGSFSSGLHGEKNDLLAAKVTQGGLGNMFLYESSREVYTFETKLPFEEYKQVFGHKTFADELEDVKRVFGFFMKTFAGRACRLHFIGSSLGGTQCSYLLPEYGDLVRDVFLFGSGVTTKNTGSTYPGYPDKNEILSNYQAYKGNLHLVQGSMDTVVPRKEALLVFESAKKCRTKNHIILEGVDHSFRKLNGIVSIPQIVSMNYEVIASHADLG